MAVRTGRDDGQVVSTHLPTPCKYETASAQFITRCCSGAESANGPFYGLCFQYAATAKQ